MSKFKVMSVLPISRIVIARNLSSDTIESLKFSDTANLGMLEEGNIITVEESSVLTVIRFAHSFSLVTDNG